MKAVALFSGPGGSTLGLKWAGIEDVTGVEWDASAVATARAAGHTVIRADVTTLDPVEVAGDGSLLLQASPPCQSFSAAGKAGGAGDISLILQALDTLADAAMCGGKMGALDH